ncbi:DNA polymerase/3'-5' exonuclease PolX [Myxococcota bacterium]|nr:DNA polymerase/3'-5' exonuclease PolX [Myxococcota bacterium]MCZ7617610.1 DNA polymerase/3'-5' exonuclease PolX [Myxococcota bacterium]
MARRRRSVSNAEVARALREMALFLEMDGVAFKPRAYEKAAQVVAGLDRPLAQIDEEAGAAGLEALPEIGAGIAERIEELLHSGRLQELEALRRERPIDVLELIAVEGLGAKRALALYDALGIRNVRELERACRAGRVREVPGFGAKSEARLLESVGFVAGSRGRQLLGTVLPLARELEARLAALPGVRHAAVAGSIRRGRETIGDLDFVVVAREPARITEAFATMPEVVRVYGRGETKALVRLEAGIDADLRAVHEASFGAALVYFTGSKAHNVELRRIAQKAGLKLNEYGLFRGRERIAGRSEEDVYDALGLAWIAPELREARGEIEAAREGRLPRLIEYGALRGDLQIQTDWSDGSASIEEMAGAARKLGLEYIAITDHTRDLAMTGGSDEARLLEQAQEIARINRKLRGFRILSGAEVNIRADGSLDIADDVLAQLDVVGAAIHSAFRQSREDATRRVLRAMRNPHVDILFHPTARLLGRREPVALDIDAVVRAAVETGTVLEIDAQPERLDLKDEFVRKAVDAGAKLAIDSDAHHPGQLGWADTLGIAVARRGWARREDVVNAQPLADCRALLKDGRAARSRRKRAARRRRRPA